MQPTQLWLPHARALALVIAQYMYIIRFIEWKVENPGQCHNEGAQN